jgi:hypothetical protein
MWPLGGRRRWRLKFRRRESSPAVGEHEGGESYRWVCSVAAEMAGGGPAAVAVPGRR